MGKKSLQCHFTAIISSAIGDLGYSIDLDPSLFVLASVNTPFRPFSPFHDTFGCFKQVHPTFCLRGRPRGAFRRPLLLC
jgi:hypothetical protein